MGSIHAWTSLRFTLDFCTNVNHAFDTVKKNANGSFTTKLKDLVMTIISENNQANDVTVHQMVSCYSFVKIVAVLVQINELRNTNLNTISVYLRHKHDMRHLCVKNLGVCLFVWKLY